MNKNQGFLLADVSNWYKHNLNGFSTLWPRSRAVSVKGAHSVWLDGHVLKCICWKSPLGEMRTQDAVSALHYTHRDPTEIRQLEGCVMSSGGHFDIKQNCHSLLHHFCGSLTKQHMYLGHQSTFHTAPLTKQLMLLHVSQDTTTQQLMIWGDQRQGQTSTMSKAQGRKWCSRASMALWNEFTFPSSTIFGQYCETTTLTNLCVTNTIRAQHTSSTAQKM